MPEDDSRRPRHTGILIAAYPLTKALLSAVRTIFSSDRLRTAFIYLSIPSNIREIIWHFIAYISVSIKRSFAELCTNNFQEDFGDYSIHRSAK